MHTSLISAVANYRPTASAVRCEISLRLIGRQARRNGWSVLFLKSLTLLIAALALASCSSLKPPTGMPSVAPVVKTSYGICPPIAGRYLDAGSAIGEDGTSLGSESLAHLLFSTRPELELKGSGSTAPPLQTPDTVTVSGPDKDAIQFEFFSGSSSIALLRQAKRGWWSHPFGYSCVAGFLILPAEHASGIFGFMTYSSTPLLLSKGTDGSLIVQSSSTEGALIMIVPVWGTKTAWYRFPPSSEATETIPGLTPQAVDNVPRDSSHNR